MDDTEMAQVIEMVTDADGTVYTTIKPGARMEPVMITLPDGTLMTRMALVPAAE